MKAKDIRAMKPADMQKELEGLLREQFNLRMQLATAQSNNTAQMGKVKRDIARIKTIMNEQKRQGDTA